MSQHDEGSPPDPALPEPEDEPSIADVEPHGTPPDSDPVTDDDTASVTGSEDPDGAVSDTPLSDQASGSAGGENMTGSEDQTAPPPPPPPHHHANAFQPPLERKLQRKVVAGVAAGLAERWGIGVTWVRLGFVVLSVFGLLGVFLYAAGWVLMPADDGTEPISEMVVRRIRAGDSWIGAALIGLAALIVIGSLDFVSGSLALAVGLFVLGVLLYRDSSDRSPPTHPTAGGPPGPALGGESGHAEVEPPAPPPTAPAYTARAPRPAKPFSILNRATIAIALVGAGGLAAADLAGVRVEIRQYFALLLGVIALGLIIGAWRGRSRLLILPGLLLVVPGFFLAFTSLTFDRLTVAHVDLRPAASSELASSYRYPAGDVYLDLTALETMPAEPLSISLDAGEITVILDSDTAATVTSRVGAGSIDDFDHQEGFNLQRVVRYRGAGEPLELDLSVDFGSIHVFRQEAR